MRPKNKKIPIATLCTIVGVSKSGYYGWLAHTHQPDKDEEDYVVIKEIFDKSKRKYGWRSIHMRLTEQGVAMNHKKVQRIMRKYHLFAKIRRRNPYKMIMKKSHEHRTCENILDRQFIQDTPFIVFGTDITYLKYNNRFAYLSAVKDFATGEIVAWQLKEHIDMSLVTETLEHLKRNTGIPTLTDVLIHSDQGFHYTNPLYISMIKSFNMIQSMSRKGNCIDNAPTESFFGHLKDDVDYKQCKTFQELYTLIEQYMTYYNTQRHQWHKNKMTPVQYRDHLLALA